MCKTARAPHAAFAGVGAGDHGRARELLGVLTELAERQSVSPFWLAVGHAVADELDWAFECLAQAVQDHDPNLLFITAVPWAIGWRHDPRYEGVLREIGLLHLMDSHGE